MDIRRIYLDPTLREGTFVSVNAWDSNLATILPAILGHQVMRGPSPHPSAVMWWRTVMQSKINLAAKERKRLGDKLGDLEKDIHSLLGKDFTDFPAEFSVKQARKGLRSLLTYSAALSWTAITKNDEMVMKEVVDFQGPNARAEITKHWSKLSDDGKRKEYAQMALGWVIGFMEVKTKKRMEDPDLEEVDLEVGMLCLLVGLGEKQ